MEPYFIDPQVIGGAEVPHEIEWARQMGAQSADIETLKQQMRLLRDELSEMRADLSAVREMLAKNMGGIRTLFAISSIAAGLGAGISELIHWVHR